MPDLRAGRTVLVGAHGNSLRALVKHLDGISDDDIVELNIPTGEPLVYELGDDLRPLEAEARRGALPAQPRGDPGRRRGRRPPGRGPADLAARWNNGGRQDRQEAVRCSDSAGRA